jgi:hypothetical protein
VAVFASYAAFLNETCFDEFPNFLLSDLSPCCRCCIT